MVALNFPSINLRKRENAMYKKLLGAPTPVPISDLLPVFEEISKGSTLTASSLLVGSMPQYQESMASIRSCGRCPTEAANILGGTRPYFVKIEEGQSMAVTAWRTFQDSWEHEKLLGKRLRLFDSNHKLVLQKYLINNTKDLWVPELFKVSLAPFGKLVNFNIVSHGRIIVRIKSWLSSFL